MSVNSEFSLHSHEPILVNVSPTDTYWFDLLRFILCLFSSLPITNNPYLLAVSTFFTSFFFGFHLLALAAAMVAGWSLSSSSTPLGFTHVVKFDSSDMIDP